VAFFPLSLTSLLISSLRQLHSPLSIDWSA
jgi:hypothetical protein